MDDVVGVALAGGRSRRLGLDKAALRLASEGRSLLALTVGRLATVCEEVVVAARPEVLAGRREQLAAESAAASDRVFFVADAPPPAAGPAAGILAAATARPCSALLVLACDLPRVPIELLERIAGEAARHEEAALVVVRRDDRFEPLCALYRPALLEALARRAAAGQNALRDLLREPLPRRELRIDASETVGGVVDPLFNLNTPEDLERLHRLERAKAL